jgi:hypothetical protein
MVSDGQRRRFEDRRYGWRIRTTPVNEKKRKMEMERVFWGDGVGTAAEVS